MKPALVCLLTLTIAACSPFQETEEEAARRLKKNATPVASPTPKPTPKSGAWMTEERENPLGIKKNPLDRKPAK